MKIKNRENNNLRYFLPKIYKSVQSNYEKANAEILVQNISTEQGMEMLPGMP